jgi:hypothetical protein
MTQHTNGFAVHWILPYSDSHLAHTLASVQRPVRSARQMACMARSRGYVIAWIIDSAFLFQFLQHGTLSLGGGSESIFSKHPCYNLSHITATSFYPSFQPLSLEMFSAMSNVCVWGVIIMNIDNCVGVHHLLLMCVLPVWFWELYF